MDRNIVVMFASNINKGYDCVDLGKFGNILKHFETPLHLKLWILNFLSSRILIAGLDTVEVRGSLPQGSCLSPILFNLYTATLHRFQEIEPIYFSMQTIF